MGSHGATWTPKVSNIIAPTPKKIAHYSTYFWGLGTYPAMELLGPVVFADGLKGRCWGFERV